MQATRGKALVLEELPMVQVLLSELGYSTEVVHPRAVFTAPLASTPSQILTLQFSVVRFDLRRFRA